MKSGLFKIPAAAISLLVLLAIALATETLSSGSSTGAGALKPTGSMGTARASHTATVLPNGKVLIAGGFAGSGGEGRPYSSVEIYDPATGAFAATASMTAYRSGHTATATLLNNGKVLIAGGWSGGGLLRTGRYPSATVFRTAELYDPATGKFTPTGNMTTVRHKHGATLLPNGEVLIVGGRTIATGTVGTRAPSLTTP